MAAIFSALIVLFLQVTCLCDGLQVNMVSIETMPFKVFDVIEDLTDPGSVLLGTKYGVSRRKSNGQIETVAGGSSNGHQDGFSALFHSVYGIRFISSTLLIATDKTNNCLREIDFSRGLQTYTETYAGSCETPGSATGHKTSEARLSTPKDIDYDSDNQRIFVCDGQRLVRIDVSSSQLYTMRNLMYSAEYITITSANMLYYTFAHGVGSVNVDNMAESVVVGGGSSGSAMGSFATTTLNKPLSIAAQPGSDITLVAEKSNNRILVLNHDTSTSEALECSGTVEQCNMGIATSPNIVGQTLYILTSAATELHIGQIDSGCLYTASDWGECYTSDSDDCIQSKTSCSAITTRMCTITNWGAWGVCSTDGITNDCQRERTRTVPGTCIDEASEHEACSISDWGAWGVCSTDGITNDCQRERTRTVPGTCIDEASEYEACSISDWGAWGVCSTDGITNDCQRERTRTVPETCTDEASEHEACSISDWGVWGVCSTDGITNDCQRERTRTVPGTCTDEASEHEACSISDWGVWGVCSTDGITNDCQRERTRTVPETCTDEASEHEACSISDWGVWGVCSTDEITNDCLRNRTRTVPGSCTDVTFEEESCSVSDWSSWGVCSTDCVQNRTRTVPGNCLGDDVEVQRCYSCSKYGHKVNFYKTFNLTNNMRMVQTVDKMRSPIECGTVCINTAECEGFVYISQTKVCTLLAGSGGSEVRLSSYYRVAD